MVDIILNILFCSVFIFFPAFIYFFAGVFGFDLRKFGIETFVVISCFLFGYVGIFFLYFELDPVRVTTGIRDTSIISWMLIGSTWSILSLVIGMLIAQCFFLNRSPHATGHTQLTGGHITGLGLLLVVCCLVFYFYVRQIDAGALSAIVHGDILRAQQIRSEATNNFVGKYHQYSVFMHQMLWCVSCISFAGVLLQQNITNRLIFLISFVAMVVTTTITGEKSPVIYYFISLFFIFICVMKNRNLVNTTTISMVGGSVLFLSAIYSIYYSIPAFKAPALVLSRAFTGGITPAYLYLSYFPDMHDFLLGQSFPNPGGLLPHTPFRLTVEVMNWFVPQNPLRGIVGSSPTMFWGELYANFGFWGVAIVPIFVGIWVGFFASVLRAIPASPITTGFMVWAAFHFSKLSSGGVFSFVLDYNLVVVTVSIVLMAVLGRVLDRSVFK